MLKRNSPQLIHVPTSNSLPVSSNPILHACPAKNMALVPPAEKGGFSYAVDSLYCESSNSSRHRRATIPELKSHFSGKDTENRTAHWYEAQLLHYGLPPSKVKGTAHKRLFDAVTAKGGLIVPAHIQKIEADLKKEWSKNERAAKKLSKPSSSAAAAPAKGTKRKAEQVSNSNISVDVSVQISNTGAVKVDAAKPAAKKAKTSGPSSSTTVPKKAAAVTPKEKKKTATKSQKANRDSKSTSTPRSAKPAAKAKAPAKPAAQRPTASSSSGRGAAGAVFGASSAGYDDAPPPYSEYDQGGGSVSYNSTTPQRSIGLLNGRYRVDCPILEKNFPEYMDDVCLIATLDGNKLWLKFDFGAATGMMQVDRPYEPDEDDPIALYWRGFVPDGCGDRYFFNKDASYVPHNMDGPMDVVWFPGGGHIRGAISYDGHDVDFDAYRLPGQSMTSEVSPTQARAEWARLGQESMETSW